MEEERMERYDLYMAARDKVISENTKRLKTKRDECEVWIISHICYAGMVHTKADADLAENKFYMWYDRGGSIAHRYVSFAEAEIAPIDLLPYPNCQDFGL